ncbi:MAG: hypothetical protein J5I98_32715 [Phaeodactylibacter sp.]|nr:hypothetical protein [Phaeodactylibacter sp.]
MQTRNLAGKMHRIFRTGILCLALSIPYCHSASTQGEDPPPPPPPPIVTEDIVDR